MKHLYPHKDAKGRRRNGFTAKRAREAFMDGRPFYTADGQGVQISDCRGGDTVTLHCKGKVLLHLTVPQHAGRRVAC
jgi:hypothetical protein